MNRQGKAEKNKFRKKVEKGRIGGTEEIGMGGAKELGKKGTDKS